jgi:hypothetical protein
MKANEANKLVTLVDRDDVVFGWDPALGAHAVHQESFHIGGHPSQHGIVVYNVIPGLEREE